MYDIGHISTQEGYGVTDNTGTILVVDDDEDILIAARLLLKRHFANVTTAHRPDQILRILEKNTFDAVLLDMNFSLGENTGDEGLSWLKQIIDHDPTIIVIVITAHGGVALAVEAMKIGATDFITKPWQNEKLVSTLKTAVSLNKSRREARTLRHKTRELEQSLRPDEMIIGESGPMQDVMSLIHRAGPTDANVMILGENGVGKELIARELHRQSRRADAIFMAVDLGAINESLFESELFGHKKGAFTDAREDRIGRMQAAEGGTLFLDEIGNLPLTLQTKLLTALERRQVTPVGANKPVDINIRLISATNMAPERLAEDSLFRQDLRFRLNTVEIMVPPLRNRTADIPLLMDHFIRHYSRKYQQTPRPMSPAALEALTCYSWPGNIRELRHGAERAVILAQGEMFEPWDFPLRVGTPAPVANEEVSLPLNTLNLDMVERTALEQAIKKHKGNISHAARELGITRASLYRRMEKHGL